MYVGAPPTELATEVFTVLPDHLVKRVDGARRNSLEGPSFDRDGNLLCVDISAGRVYRISPKGEWEVLAEYDGIPNGLKLHRDGRAFIADRKRGVMVVDPAQGNDRLPAARAEGGREFSWSERSDFRRERRSVFHRPGPHRAAIADRARLALYRRRQSGMPDRQRAEPERAGVQRPRDRAVCRGDAGERGLAHRAGRSGASDRTFRAALRGRSRRAGAGSERQRGGGASDGRCGLGVQPHRRAAVLSEIRRARDDDQHRLWRARQPHPVHRRITLLLDPDGTASGARQDRCSRTPTARR